eukprot:gene13022-3530_t
MMQTSQMQTNQTLSDIVGFPDSGRESRTTISMVPESRAPYPPPPEQLSVPHLPLRPLPINHVSALPALESISRLHARPPLRPPCAQSGGPPPAPKSDPPKVKPDLLDPSQTIVWGGTLPSSRRAVVGVLASTAIVLGGDLGGITSWLLGLDNEFVFPGSWLADQTLVVRAARRAEAERFMDLTPIESEQVRIKQQEARAFQNVTEPVVAFGPPNSVGEENISVIVAPIYPGFKLASLGTPEQSANIFMGMIAPEGSGKEAQLIESGQRLGPGGQLYYFVEYRIKGKSFYRHNVSVYGSKNDKLYTFNAQCPVPKWEEDKEMLKNCAMGGERGDAQEVGRFLRVDDLEGIIE